MKLLLIHVFALILYLHFHLITSDQVETASRPDAIECPSAEIITTRYKCHVRGQWIDCFRKHCCVGYTYIAGRCIANDKDPCSTNICEQKCSVYFGRVICSCFHGFQFDYERQRAALQPYCVDVDECADNNGNCEHFCNNSIGNYHCSCKSGYELRSDNKTCEPIHSGAFTLPQVVNTRCVASCDVVSHLEFKIQELEEKLQAITTAIRLHNFGSGPPGPEGNPGPPGPQGPRGFPGPQGPRGDSGAKSEESNLEKGDWTLVQVGGKKKSCVCKRGPVGAPGAEGRAGIKGSKGDMGIKGEKGQEGSFDFLLLVLADVRHDIQVLQQAVFQQQTPARYDIASALQKHNI